ncbi:amidohydrolase family protein [Nocardia harenae]|uniref:amidohydrolase family protein n=1 Tax=Nocardia harenae TaxID=358707 RepID=UPI0008366196|nr:amidohydrolase family protein [Nocardia harenae]
MSWLIRDVSLADGRAGLDVRLGGGVITEIGPGLRTGAETEVDGGGGVLLPGLHDHHIHLHGAAAARESIDCTGGLAALTGASSARIRAVGAGVSVDRHTLDRLVPDRPVRVQHRSGALWMLNTPALAELAPLPHLPGVERDAAGEPTGRLWRLDYLLRGTWPPRGDLTALGRELTAFGITGVTDATPGLTEPPALPQRVTLLGARKLLLHDHDLPGYDELRDRIAALHRRGLPVAVHCVTRVSLLLTLAVLDEVGMLPGDRIEHGAVVPDPELLRGLTVVTQPGFVVAHRERYRAEVDPEDLPHLYPYATLLAADVAVLPSSDAPYGPLDPWAIMRAAASRDLGPHERVPVRTVLDGFLRDACLRPRAVAVGAPADLLVLAAPLRTALDTPDAALVRLVWIDGQLASHR